MLFWSSRWVCSQQTQCFCRETDVLWTQSYFRQLAATETNTFSLKKKNGSPVAPKWHLYPFFSLINPSYLTISPTLLQVGSALCHWPWGSTLGFPGLTRTSQSCHPCRSTWVPRSACCRCSVNSKASWSLLPESPLSRYLHLPSRHPENCRPKSGSWGVNFKHLRSELSAKWCNPLIDQNWPDPKVGRLISKVKELEAQL